ncbi:MAG TPA: response regulator transcription factor [Anaerolineales bacterium]|nr:response regulator transcription factor [Anaerolineales bacterium]
MRALIVDDDRVLADIVAFALRREGFEIIQAHDGASGLRRWEAENPDLIILDVNLPEIDGFTFCRQIRERSTTPIIMLTVRGEDNDIVRGLEIGADDYIPKPFSPRQLVARAFAVLRRAGQMATPTPHQAGDLQLAANRREARIGYGDPIPLTPLEGKLLTYLMINAGQVLTADAIIDYVWGPQSGDRDMLRQLVHRLRDKIEPDPGSPTYRKTVPGLGYGLIADND